MNEIAKFSRLGITKIKDVEILNNTDLTVMTDLSSELQDVYEKKQVHRTLNEMKYSVLSDKRFNSIPSKYWQSVREQNVMFTQLVFLSCDYGEKQGELELAEIALDDLKNTKKDMALKKIKNSQIKRLQFQLMEMRLVAHHRVREINSWESIKQILVRKEQFDTTDPNTHQIDLVGFDKLWI